MNEKFLNILIKECKKAFKKDEVPIACIITKDNKIISKSHNLKHKTNFILNHAEVLAIKKAAKKNKDWRLNGYDMYVTLEPCDMCKEIIKQSRIDNVYYIVNSNFKKVNTYNTNYKKLEIDNNFFNEIINNFFANKR